MKRKLKPKNENFLSDVKALLSSEIDSNYIIDINKVKIKHLKRSDIMVIPFSCFTAKKQKNEPNDADFFNIFNKLLSSNLDSKYIVGLMKLEYKYEKEIYIIKIPIRIKTKKDETNEKLSKLVIDSKMFEQ
jgi:hypothetical protein